MAKYRVAISDYVFPDVEPEKGILEPLGAEVVAAQCESIAELISIAKDADALLNCYFGPVGEELFEASPKLRAVVRYGIGVDTIDIPAATRHGIMVANVPDYCLDEVSDHTVALLLCLARKIALADRNVKSGNYDLAPLKPLPKLQGQTVGFLGFGRIGRLVAKKLAAFGFEFLFYDPYVEDAAVGDARNVSLQELLRRSDFLLVHAPETEETRHILGRETLSLMRPTACVVNTARGGLVDTEALVEALRAGRLAGAALDLIENVPPISPDHPLCRMDNVVLTPHSAWYSESALKELQTRAAQEVARVLSGEPPRSLLNPEVLEKRS